MPTSLLFLDEEVARLKQGRLSGEEAALKAELSAHGFSLKLPGLRNAFGPSISSWMGVPALRSSRASANGKRPFHLHHSTVSMQDSIRSVAKPGRTYFQLTIGDLPRARQTAGAALSWQPSAKSWWAPSGSAAAARMGARYAVEPPPIRAPSPSSKPAGSAAAHQRYIERDRAVARDEEDGMEREPEGGMEREGEGGRERGPEGAVYSRGTIGDDIDERAAFWHAVEGRERADGLVQCRIVAEVPHELSKPAQRAAMENFMTVFAERGLPAHAVVHRPDAERRPEGGGDARNVHAHVVYHDRPCVRDGPGSWTFAARKDREARGPAWVRELRERWAGACNEALEREQKATRFHPGSYADLGIDKVPQAHLGPVLSAFERQGRSTRPGAVNLICERDWERRQALAESVRLAEGSVTWLRRQIALERGTAEAAGEASGLARRTLFERISRFNRRAILYDADAEVARRDEDGRNRRAGALRDHASRQAARGGGAAAHWQRIAEAVAGVATRGAAGADRDISVAAGPSAQRLDAHCRAAERRLDAATLVDWRLDLAAELKQRGKSAGDEAPAAELGEDGKRLLARLVSDRATAAMLEGEVAGTAAGDGAAASPEARQQAAYARRARDLREREAKRRSELIAELEPQLGMDAAAGVEALVRAAEKARLPDAAPARRGTPDGAREEAVGAPAGDDLALRRLDREADARRRREAARRRELADQLKPLFGGGAGAAAEALARAAEQPSGPPAIAHDAKAGVVVLPPSPEAALDEAAGGCLRRLVSDRKTAAMLEGEVAGTAAGDGAAAASPEARQQAAYARRARDLREREAKRLDELAWHLAPVFGRDAEAAAAALADSAARGSGGLVRRGEDGRITASSGALEARQAAGALRLLLTAQRAARVAEDAAAKAARRRGRKRGADKARRDELQRQLEAADAAISQQPLALRVARGAGAEEAVMASVRKAGKAEKRRREASRGSER